MSMVDHARILLTATSAAALKDNTSENTANKASFSLYWVHGLAFSGIETLRLRSMDRIPD